MLRGASTFHVGSMTFLRGKKVFTVDLFGHRSSMPRRLPRESQLSYFLALPRQNCRSALASGKLIPCRSSPFSATSAEHSIAGLTDPFGGTFDAAGDFDRLIPPSDGDYRLLTYVDPYGDTVFNRPQMPDLLADLDALRARPGTEERGVARLRRLAEECRDGVHLYVWFIGD